MSKNVKDSIAYNKVFALPAASRDLDPATILDALPGEPTGLLPRSALESAIQVQIAPWDSTSPIESNPDYLMLEWLPEGEQLYLPIGLPIPIWVEPPTPAPPILRTIPVSMFAQREGRFQFRYRVDGWNSEGEQTSLDADIIIDRKAPQLPPLDQSEIVVTHPVITDATLATDNGLLGTIPDFTEENNKAAVKAFVALLAKVPEHISDIDPADLHIVDPLLSHRQITVPTPLVNKIGSGTRYLVYVLFDKAGNDTAISWPTTVQIALGAWPSGLKALTVNAQEAKGLVDIEAVDDGVFASIRSFDNPDPFDRIRVLWKDQVMAPEPPVGAAEFPLRVPMYAPQMMAAYDFDVGGEQTVDVLYSVLRGDWPIPYTTPYQVNVNFEYPGPWNPDIPGPNPNLEFAHVYGTDDNEDVLRLREDAKIKIKLFDTSPAEMAGIIITVYWGGKAVGTYPVSGSEQAGTVIELNLLWADIEEVANDPSVVMFYTLSKPNVHNPQKSKPTFVDVEVISVELDEVQFPHNFNGMLTCASLRDHDSGSGQEWGIWVHIPASRYVREGDTLEATWQSYQEDKTTEIVNTDVSASFVVTEDQERDGIDWFIAYERNLKPTYGGNLDQYGFGFVNYEANSYPSTPKWVLVAMGQGPEEEITCILPPFP